MSEVKNLFRKYHAGKDKKLKEKIVGQHYNLVVFIAKKFIGRGESLDDLIQVGLVGLLKAMENYDPDNLAEFATYAMPMIVGEIKHYFRDYARLVKLPRKIHELNSQIKKTIFEFHQNNDRSPTIEELANALNVTEEDVILAMEAGEAAKALSLDSPSFMSERSGEVVTNSKSSLMDSLGIDHIENKIINRETLKFAIANLLNRREQRIIYMRFYDGLSQQEIADFLELSQMHVSRLLKHAIKKLRRYITRDLKSTTA